MTAAFGGLLTLCTVQYLTKSGLQSRLRTLLAPSYRVCLRRAPKPAANASTNCRSSQTPRSVCSMQHNDQHTQHTSTACWLHGTGPQEGSVWRVCSQHGMRWERVTPRHVLWSAAGSPGVGQHVYGKHQDNRPALTVCWLKGLPHDRVSVLLSSSAHYISHSQQR